MVALMNGLAKPAVGVVDPTSPGSATRASRSGTTRPRRGACSPRPAIRRAIH
ncbi:hypothetical protein ACFQY5_28505 [Paeniroseomonas aquatica]|uniref:hypothetical protein n=1 Tax=Paeniroseomonas aquatica TaxID=373043 RepID=UPI003610EAF9